MVLDRSYQLELLNSLASCYPHNLCDEEALNNLISEATKLKKYAANMIYLEEHGLVESGVHISADNQLSISSPRINARGMDFLASDGGLSAVLGVVTIKFDDQTLRELIGEKINLSSQPPENKKKWLSQLQSLPSDAIKHLTLKLLEMGLEHSPEAIHTIQMFFQSHG